MKIPNPSSQASVALFLLAVLILGALWVFGMPFFFEEVRLLGGSKLNFAPYQLRTWGNTLIAASATLYVANLYLSLGAVGRWATRFARAGAAVLLLDIGADLLGLVRESPGAYQSSTLGFYDVISVMVPMGVVWYLVVEKAHQDRTPGAFVMWVILCFIAVEMWLLAANAGSTSVLIRVFHDYWGQAYLLAHVIGYGAFVLAAASGILYLARDHIDARGIRHPVVTRWLPDSRRARSLMVSAIGVGVPVFVLALFLVLGWGLGAEMRPTFAWVKGLWVAGVLAFYGGFLYILVTRIMPAQRMAWLTVLGLGLTLAAFVATHVVGHDVATTPSGVLSSSAATSNKDWRAARDRQVRRVRFIGPTNAPFL